MKSLPLLLFFILPAFVCGQQILQYHSVLLLAEPKQGTGPPKLAIRSFIQDMEHKYLLVDLDSISTRIAAANDFNVTSTNWSLLRQNWADKPYIIDLNAARQNDAVLQDAGLTRSKDHEAGISLTADLCPSHLPLDRRVFSALIQYAGASGHPIPIALSISGLWMQTHAVDIAWLKAANGLSITWINHTLHHHWDKNLPLNKNFLLERGTDLSIEVLGNEELMLEKGLLPSCFFRFPGLVSDKAISDQILDWGLIPVGSDAWLAKGQRPKASGSIVLIHANGNEPIGIDDFLHLLQQEQIALQHGQWHLLDLREELEKE